MFDLGIIIINKGLKFKLNKNNLTNEDLYKFLRLHLLNKYTTLNKEIFIDTHLGKINQTTIMFTSEY